jgi:hypothetical protein
MGTTVQIDPAKSSRYTRNTPEYTRQQIRVYLLGTLASTPSRYTRVHSVHFTGVLDSYTRVHSRVHLYTHPGVLGTPGRYAEYTRDT